LARSRSRGLVWSNTWRLRMAAAAMLGMLVVLGAAACKNREVETAERATADVAAINWSDKDDVAGKLRELDTLRAAMDRLPSTKAGDTARAKGNEALMQATRVGLVQPLVARLEAQLRAETGAGEAGYPALKTYLMLGDRARAKTFQPWLTTELVRRSTEELQRRTKASPSDLRQLLLATWSPYVEALVSGGVEPEELDASLVQQVRDIRRRVGDTARVYDELITSLGSATIDPGSPPEGANLRYPPAGLKDVFADQPAVLSVLRSRRFQSEGKWQVVEGPYTANGYHAVQRGMKEYLERRISEAWVISSDPKEEAESKYRGRLMVARAEQDYEQEYAKQWQAFLLDIEVTPAKDDKELAAHLKILATEPCPLRRLLQVLRDQTETMQAWEDGKPTEVEAKPNERIHAPFAATLAFAGPANDSGLAQYLEAMRAAYDKLAQGDRAGLKAAEQRTRELLWKLDEPGQKMLGPLLLAPVGAK
jgi:type VI protein secretion system component VasK